MTAIFIAFALSATSVAAPAQSVPLPTPAPKHAPRPPAAAPQTAQPPARGPQGEVNQRSLIDRISMYLSSVQTLVGNFVQVGPDGTRTEGQLYVQKPGRVRFEYKAPSVIEVVADGNLVAVRDRRLSTQDLYPLSQTPLRFLLADRIDLSRDTNVVSVSQDDMFVTVVIEERQLLTGTNRLMMMFAAKDLQLRQWTVTDPQGYDTTVAVYNLDTTTRPDPALFVINSDNDAQRIQ